MAVFLPISILKNRVTDRIHENHERAITGVDLQEILHDIIDSLHSYINTAIVEPAENYYVNDILIDGDTRTITLVRAGGIEPINISESLKPLDNPEGILDLPAGDTVVEFDYPLPVGTVYVLMKSVIANNGGFDISSTITDKTHTGFKINVREAATLTYRVIR